MHELNFGIFEKKTPKDILSGELASEFQKWRNEEISHIPLGVESFDSASKRAFDFIKEISQYDETYLVVSHGVFLRILLCSCILNISPHHYRKLKLDNGSISIVEWENDYPRLTKLNY